MRSVVAQNLDRVAVRWIRDLGDADDRVIDNALVGLHGVANRRSGSFQRLGDPYGLDPVASGLSLGLSLLIQEFAQQRLLFGLGHWVKRIRQATGLATFDQAIDALTAPAKVSYVKPQKKRR